MDSSTPVIWQADDDANDGLVEGRPAKLISTNPQQVSFVKLSAGGSAVIALHDARDLNAVNQNNKRWLLDASATGNDNSAFSLPILFKTGIVAVLEQGSGFAPTLCIAVAR